MLLMADTAGSFPPGLPSPASGTGKRPLRGKGRGAAGPGPLVLRTGRAHHARLRRAGSVQAGKRRGKAACGALRGNSSRSPRTKRHGGNGRKDMPPQGQESQKQRPSAWPAFFCRVAGVMPFFATARACRTRGGERRAASSRRRHDAFPGLSSTGTTDAFRENAARAACPRARGRNGRRRAKDAGQERGRKHGGRTAEGTGESCRRRPFPHGGGGPMRWGAAGFLFPRGLFPPACGGGGGIHRGREAARK